MVDKDIVKDKLGLLEEYILDLAEYNNLTIEELEDNKILFRYLERTLHLAVEAILDIGSHIISDERLGNPKFNSEIIKILAKNDIIKDNLDDYVKMAKFRNIIVHDYAEIDAEILLKIVKENVTDLKEIFKWYREYIS
ncbi:MAG: type VII toxin-antitoxin system HepT family RNase toxin [Candidatus Woesearchaeota archaeon]